MVETYRGSSSTSDEMNMMSENDVFSDGTSTSSESSCTECPHCDFRCTSPGLMTQHSWDEHPLLMRRKKHLITSRKDDDVRPELDKASNQEIHDSANDKASAIHKDLDMQKCSLDTSKHTSEASEITRSLHTNISQHEHNMTQETLQNQDIGTAGVASMTSQANTAPQRHVAVVRPVLNEHQAMFPGAIDPSYLSRFQAMQHNLQQQSMKLLSQPTIQDQLVYAPMFSVLIPGLNQYVTIPVPVGGVVPQTKYPSVGAMNQNISTAQYIPSHVNPTSGVPVSMGHMNPPAQQPGTGNADFIDYEVIRERLLGPRPPNQNVKEVNPLQVPQQPTTWQRSSPERPTCPSNPTNDVRTLLQTRLGNRNTTGPSVQNCHSNGYMSAKNENACGEKGAFPSANPSRISELPKVEPMGGEKLQALEEALRFTDCCNIEDKSSTMPFRCPDGVWRMVTFKCIRGVWLVQMPGSSTPTVYVPCDKERLGDTDNNTPSSGDKTILETEHAMLIPGSKRRFSDPLHSSPVIDAKRLCASAPNPAVQCVGPEPVTLKRTFSNPSLSNRLPAPSQSFTNNEGKKINISMIKTVPGSKSTSSNLIRSLLLRKPVTQSKQNDVRMTSLNSNVNQRNFASESRACMLASERHITERLSTFNHSPAIRTDTLAY